MTTAKPFIGSVTLTSHPSLQRRLAPIRSLFSPLEGPLPSKGLEPLVEGKKFLCTECGKCCTGAGEVWANTAETKALARSLGLSESHFNKKFTKKYSKRPGWYLLQRKQGSGECIFLADDKKRCLVYNARPMQCTTYPFWPELMNDEMWSQEASDVCEGINHADAKEVDVAYAAQQLALSSAYTAEFDAAGASRSSGRKRA